MQQTTTGEMRQNLLTHHWVIYAPDRAERPNEMREKAPKTVELPEKDAACPFCSGNEKMIPPIAFELPSRTEGMWQTRVVLNKYPILLSDAEVASGRRGLYRTATNFGDHQVIIETPFHNRDIPFMDPSEVEAIIDTYSRCYGALYDRDEAIKTVIVFRNHGPRAGTSLLHPHSQIIATDLIPESIAQREHIAEDHYRRHRRCILCDMLVQEQEDAERMISENESFVSFVPFAAGAPCEVWIAPKQHCADFGLITRQERSDLAAMLQDILLRLHDALDGPDYNYVVHSSSRQDTIVPHLHWYLQVRPRLSLPAGFEIGSGMEVNHSLPERDAQLLRENA